MEVAVPITARLVVVALVVVAFVVVLLPTVMTKPLTSPAMLPFNSICSTALLPPVFVFGIEPGCE